MLPYVVPQGSFSHPLNKNKNNQSYMGISLSLYVFTKIYHYVLSAFYQSYALKFLCYKFLCSKHLLLFLSCVFLSLVLPLHSPSFPAFFSIPMFSIPSFQTGLPSRADARRSPLAKTTYQTVRHSASLYRRTVLCS